MDLELSATGFSEVNGALARLSEAIPVATQHIALTAAGITIESARPTIPVVSGDSKRSLRHYLTDSGGALAEGGSSVDYYRWLELGGLSGRKHTTRRDVVPEGRYIYPGYLRKQNVIENMMSEEMIDTIQKVGLG